MPDPVFANGRTMIHAGDGLAFTSTSPDACKTPSPGGPVPTPYVNVARSAALKGGTKRVTIGGKSVATVAACLENSTGDEPGTAGGGLISAKTRGKLTWIAGSPNVRFEGKQVVRFLDQALHNGNASNTLSPSPGSAGTPGEEEELDLSKCLWCGGDLDDTKLHPPLRTDDKKLMQGANDPKKHRFPRQAKTVGGMKTEGNTSYAFARGGDGCLFNLQSGKKIKLTPRQVQQLESLGNPLGNCVEQRLLRRAFLGTGVGFPPKGKLKMGIAEALHGKPTPKELAAVRHKPPCGTCEVAMVAMLCTNEQAPELPTKKRGGD